MIEPDPNFTVFNEEIEMQLKGLGDTIASALPPGFGFTLLLYDFGENGSLFYTSNGKREDVIKMMEEFIKLNQPSKGLPSGPGIVPS